jgi:hypothetical protein
MIGRAGSKFWNRETSVGMPTSPIEYQHGLLVRFGAAGLSNGRQLNGTVGRAFPWWPDARRCVRLSPRPHEGLAAAALFSALEVEHHQDGVPQDEQVIHQLADE